jgi:hypothetical protein
MKSRARKRAARIYSSFAPSQQATVPPVDRLCKKTFNLFKNSFKPQAGSNHLSPQSNAFPARLRRERNNEGMRDE